MEEQDAYRVKLEVFEGPMDLLLHLIKKNEIDIYDIPIALITGQYLEYIELMKQLNIDVAGEFLVLAAELIHIKSKMLLPKSEFEEAEEEGPDPRDELVRRLLEYQQFKEAAESLRERELLGRDVFVRGATAQDWVEVPGDFLAPLSLFHLIEAFQRLLEKTSGEVEVAVDRVSVRERIIELLDKLRSVESITFDELFEGAVSRRELILTFLAILEMIRLAVLKVYQPDISGVIRLFPVSQENMDEKGDLIKDDYL
jgi:segregation and condensation protein A